MRAHSVHGFVTLVFGLTLAVALSAKDKGVLFKSKVIRSGVGAEIGPIDVSSGLIDRDSTR